MPGLGIDLRKLRMLVEKVRIVLVAARARQTAALIDAAARCHAWVGIARAPVKP